MPTSAPLERESDAGSATSRPTQFVSDQSLVVRNYDGATAHELRVSFVGPDGEEAFARTVTVEPLGMVTVETRLERAVYRVEARLDDDESDSTECLVGSGPNETAFVETGNGTVSVVEGLL